MWLGKMANLKTGKKSLKKKGKIDDRGMLLDQQDKSIWKTMQWIERQSTYLVNKKKDIIAQNLVPVQLTHQRRR